MIKQIVCMLLFFMIPITLNANIVTFACPRSVDIQFYPINNTKEHIAIAPIRIINGATPSFKMQGITKANHANNFLQAIFIRDHLFCIYQYKVQGISKTFTLENINTPGLEYCYFFSTKRDDCEGEIENCYLKCEIL